MNNQNYTNRFTVDRSPEEVFAAIKNVHGWWSEEIVGPADKVGDKFIHSVLDLHRCDLQVTELVPSQKVAWKVLDNYFSFTEDETEWKNTDILFEIVKTGDKTELRFTHIGLVPTYECYAICCDGWNTYLNSLKDLIVSGKGNPNVGQAITESEKSLLQAK